LYGLASRRFQIENLTEKLLGPSFLWLIIAIWLIESPKREDGTGRAILNQAKLQNLKKARGAVGVKMLHCKT
jgi:hypothetical protein